MCVDREARAWFGELSWHLKVPWNLISAKRFPIHTLRVEQRRLEVFCFEDNGAMTQFQFELKFPTAELPFWWPGISWKPSSLAVTWGAPPWKRKNCFLNAFTKTFLTKNNQLFSWTFPTWLVAEPLWKRKNCFLNTFTKTFLTKNNQLFSWTFPTWLVAVLRVDREARAWFGELSWHLKVPWNLISAKRIPKHRVPTQIMGGTAGVGGFLVSTTMMPWLSFNLNWVFQLWSWNFGGQKFLGNHPLWLSRWGPPLAKKQLLSHTFTKSHKTQWIVFMDIPPWLVALMFVNRETGAWFGELSWHLKVPSNLISAKNVFQYIQPQCRLKVEQLLLEFFCFDDNDAMTQFQFELKFPTAELTFWWPQISWKPSSLAVTWGAPLCKRNNSLNTFTKNFRTKNDQLFSWTFPYVIGCRDVCGSWNRGLVTWFWKLSWHLKVPWNLISAKRIPKHRVPTQIMGGTAGVGGFLFRRQWRHDSVSIWIEFGGQKFLGNHPLWLSRWGPPVAKKKLLSHTFSKSHKTQSVVFIRVFMDIPPWLVALMFVNRETGAWFGELSWHLKVPSNLISAKNVFQYIKSPNADWRWNSCCWSFFVSTTMTPWLSFNLNWNFQLRNWHFGGHLGNHPVWLSRGGPPFGRETIPFWTLLQRIFLQNTTSCFRGHSPMWLVAVVSVDREARAWLGELSWHLKVPSNLISAKNVFQYIQSQCRLKVEQLLLEFFCFDDNDAMTQFQFELKFPTAELTFWWPEISWKLETIQFGCAVGGLPFGREKIAFWTVLQKKIRQKANSCFRGHSLRDWLPWCVWIVKEGLGLENCLDTLRFLGT